MVWEIYKTICTVLVTGVLGVGVLFGLLISLMCLIDTVNENVLAKKKKKG